VARHPLDATTLAVDPQIDNDPAVHSNRKCARHKWLFPRQGVARRLCDKLARRRSQPELDAEDPFFTQNMSSHPLKNILPFSYDGRVVEPAVASRFGKFK
jgi:hypothetical protein